jgi:hypothetical protein
MMMRTANTAARRLGRPDAHRAALNGPVNRDAASAAAFLGRSGSAWEVARARRLGAQAIRVLPRQSQLELLVEDRAIVAFIVHLPVCGRSSSSEFLCRRDENRKAKLDGLMTVGY